MEDLGCAHCAAEIEHEVSKLGSILKASFDFVSETLRVELLNGNRFPELTGRMQEIAQSHESGIRLTEHWAAQTSERILYLKGLDCADYAVRIEREIQKLDGIREARMSFIAQCVMLKTGDREKLPVLIRETIRTIGEIESDITVSFHEEETGENEGENRKRISRILLVADVVLFAAAMAILMTGLPPFLLLLVAYLLIGGEILLTALYNIQRGQISDEDFLMSITTIGAFVVREFPGGVAVMLFYYVGEPSQDMAVSRSHSSIKVLMDIRSSFANLKLGDEVRHVSPEETGIGDLILVKTDEKIPLDSVVVQGISSLDTSTLAGESLPRDVQPGNEVLSGSINQNGFPTVQVQKEFGDPTISRIPELVQSVSDKKTPTENFTTKFARHYAPAIVFATLALAVIPPLVVSGAELHLWIHYTLAFLVVPCPCVLVTSIPLSFFDGIDAASHQGILIKGSNYLEALNSLDTVIFDKTDTLTRSNFIVAEVLLGEAEKAELLCCAALAESVSTYPITRPTIRAYGQPVDGGQATRHTEIVGHGTRAVIDGKAVLAGNSRLMKSENIRFEPISTPGSLVYPAVDGEYVGCLMISDEIRPDSRKAVKALRQAEVHTVVMLTSDSQAMVESVTKTTGIGAVYSKLLPDQKVEHVKLLDNQESSGGKLAFVGDGINDTPVLARVNIGITMGGIGSGTAIEAADIVLTTNELSKLPAVVRIVKKTHRIVWQNTWLALGIKAVILILAVIGIATMWAAVFGDVGVALIAVLNATHALRTE